MTVEITICCICKKEVQWDKDKQWSKPEMCIQCVAEGFTPQMASE